VLNYYSLVYITQLPCIYIAFRLECIRLT